MKSVNWLENLRMIMNLGMLGVLILSVGGFHEFSTPPTSITLKSGARLQWSPCWFKAPIKTRCAYFFPEEDRSSNRHAQIQIPVVIIKSRHQLKKSTPLLYLSGGPGYPTGLEREDMEQWWKWFEEKDLPYDLVLFDQRGTGRGHPQLRCPQVVALMREILDQPLSRHQTFLLVQPMIKQCYTKFKAMGISLSNYTTSANSHDVMELMELLGKDTQWNLYGISYGTRLALAVLRDYPHKIRSAILDSVYPPEKHDLLETPFLYQHALTTLFNGCQKNRSCRTAFPKLEASFFKLLEKFRKTPLSIIVSDPVSGHSLKVSMTDENLVEMIFQSLYDTHLISLIPAAIHTALQGKNDFILPLVQEYVDVLLDSRASEGTYLSVECHDNGDVTREQFLARVAQYPRFKHFVETFWDTWFCHLWKAGDAGEKFRQPVTSEIPTLFLAGTYDPITPSIWTRTVATRFAHGYFFEFPNVGHGVLDSHACASLLVRDFLQAPHRKPYRDCLKTLPEPEFLTHLDLP